MKKPLNERVNSFLSSDRVTITDLGAIIPEATAEHDRLQAIHDKALADSIDIALGEPDRDAASDLADRTGRNAKALSSAIDRLTTKLAAKRESDAQRALKARRDAALRVRDELAARIPEIYNQATTMLIGLAHQIMASDAEMKAAGLQAEKGAEALARGCHNNHYIKNSPVTRLTQIRLPELDGAWDLWPPRGENLAAAFTQYEPRLPPKPDPVEAPKRFFPIGAVPVDGAAA